MRWVGRSAGANFLNQCPQLENHCHHPFEPRQLGAKPLRPGSRTAATGISDHGDRDLVVRHLGQQPLRPVCRTTATGGCGTSADPRNHSDRDLKPRRPVIRTGATGNRNHSDRDLASRQRNSRSGEIGRQVTGAQQDAASLLSEPVRKGRGTRSNDSWHHSQILLTPPRRTAGSGSNEAWLHSNTWWLWWSSVVAPVRATRDLPATGARTTSPRSWQR